MRTRKWQAPLMCVVFAGLLALNSTGATMLRAQGNNRAGIVVQFSDGNVASQCITFSEPSISGYELLRRAGLPLIAETSGVGTAICKIGNTGCDFPSQSCFCQCGGSASCIFWAYYHLSSDGKWQFSQTGATTYQVNNGAVEGWVWGSSSSNGGNTMPPVTTFDQICNAVPATATPTEAPTTQPTATSTSTPLPTQTATALPSATNTAVPAPQFILAATDTPAPSPTLRPTESPQSTATLLPTSVPRATDTPVAPVLVASPAQATATLIAPSATPMSPPTETPTSLPGATSEATTTLAPQVAQPTQQPEVIAMSPAVVTAASFAQLKTPTPLPTPDIAVANATPSQSTQPDNAMAASSLIAFGVVVAGLAAIAVVALRIRKSKP